MTSNEQSRTTDDDLSLVDGGPAYRAMLRLRLAPPAPARVAWRVAFFAALTWPPLLILSAAGGRALGGEVAVPFLKDFVAHVRFLIALPLLVVAEPLVGVALAKVARQFVDAHIVPEGELASFRRAASAASRLRDSVAAEVVILTLAYLGALASVGVQLSTRLATWRAAEPGSAAALTAAGWWYVLVSVPMFQFLLYRWVWRFALWALFLWRVARLKLRLIPIHPDRAAGVGFLEAGQGTFGMVGFALGAILSAMAAWRVLYEGASLSDIQRPLVAFVLLAVVVPILPLFAFIPKLARTKWQGTMDYGVLGAAYAGAFQEAWVESGERTPDDMLGSADIQSLADLSGSVEVVREMRVIPVGARTVVALAVAAAAPLLPLALLVYPAAEIVAGLAGILF